MAKRRFKKKKPEIPVFKIIAAILFLLFAIIIRYKSNDLFYSLETAGFSGHLQGDTPDIGALLWSLFTGKTFPVFLKYYFLPSFLLLFPAIFMGAAGLSGWIKDSRTFDFLNDKRKERIFIFTFFIFVLISGVIIRLYFFHNHMPVGDEVSIKFQAGLLREGKLYAESPPLKEFFQTSQMINDGKWYSKYTVGWPLIIAIGDALHLEFLLNSLFAALTVVMLYLICRELFEKEAGVIAGFMAAFSPFFFLMIGTFQPHTSSGFFTLLFIYGIIKTYNDEKWIYPVLSGVGIAALVSIRPADATMMMAGISPLTVFLFFKANKKKDIILKLAVIALILIAGIGALLVVNKIQTGDPLKFGFYVYDPAEKWGFDHKEHTPGKGLWNVVFALMRNCFWIVPFIGTFSLLSLMRKEAKTTLLLCPPLVVILFYFGYYSIGNFEVGSRYYYLGFITSLIPASAGVLWVKNWLKNREKIGSESFICSFLLFSLIFMLFGVYVRFLPTFKQIYADTSRVARWLEKPSPAEPPAIVFVRHATSKYNASVYTRNTHKLSGQTHWKVLFLTPEDNKKLLEKYPDRNAYVLNYKEKENVFNIQPYNPVNESAEDYYFAALNYQHGVDDVKKAEEVFLEGLEKYPGNPVIRWQLAYFYFDQKKYDKALKIYGDMTGDVTYGDNARYMIGWTYWETGEREKAVEIFRNLVKTTSNRSLAQSAQKWIDYYTGHPATRDFSP